MKKYLIKDAGKVTIEILRQRKVQSFRSSVRSHKGIIKTRRPEDDLLPRRYTRANTNFYDLGQYLVAGVWTDRYLEADLDSDFSVLEEFVNSPLAEPLADWYAKYRPIASADILKYQIAVRINSGSLRKLRSNLTIRTPVSRFALETYTGDDANVFYEKGGLFAVFDTENCKITASPDYNADSVPFELAANVPTDIFLNLAIFSVFNSFQNSYSQGEEDGGSVTLPEEYVIWSGQEFDPEFPAPPGDDTHDAVIEYLTIFTTDSDDEIFESKIINWKREFTALDFVEDDTLEEADIRAGAYLIDEHGATAIQRVLDAVITNHYTVGHTLPFGSLLYPYFRASSLGGTWRGFSEPFPTTAIESGGGTTTETPLSAWTHSLNFNPRDTPEGLLKAVFSQSGNQFYVWSTVGSG